MRTPALLTVAFLTACRPMGDDGEAHVERLPALAASAGDRIGDRDDPDRGFSRIYGMDVGPGGRLFVGEAMVPEIRVYEPDGALVRRIGRRGAGPGEFESPPRFGVAGDTVWTIEMGGATRIALFDTDGAVLATGRTDGVAVALPSGYGYVLPWTMRADGMFTGRFARVAYGHSDSPTGVQPTDSIPWPAVLFDPTGAVTDTLAWIHKPPPRMWRPPSEVEAGRESLESGGRTIWLPRPPAAYPWWESVEDGHVIVDAPAPADPDDGVFIVTRVDLAGDTVYSTPIHYTPAPYTGAELDTIAARAARGGPGGMVPYAPGRPPPPDWEATANLIRANMEFPPFRLPVRYPWVSDDGAVWIRLTGDETGTARWIILDPDGTPRGRLDLPADIRPLWTDGDSFWAAAPDDLEVPWLVHYRLGETGDGPSP